MPQRAVRNRSAPSVAVELTEEGRQAWRSTFDPQTNEEEQVLSVLTADEREQVKQLIAAHAAEDSLT